MSLFCWKWKIWKQTESASHAASWKAPGDASIVQAGNVIVQAVSGIFTSEIRFTE